jgi:glyoxalase family protein
LERPDPDHLRFALGEGGTGAIVDFVLEPALDHAGWMYGEGIMHHTTLGEADSDIQSAVKGHPERIGFTDVSERTDRGYFLSVYVRTPGGACFEATVSKPEGFLIDEPYEGRRKNFQVPPQFADQREFSYLEPIGYTCEDAVHLSDTMASPHR